HRPSPCGRPARSAPPHRSRYGRKAPTPHGHAAGSARMRTYLLWGPRRAPCEAVAVTATRKEERMPVRLVITTHAKPGKGTALAQAMADRCRAVQQGPGCQEFAVRGPLLFPDTSRVNAHDHQPGSTQHGGCCPATNHIAAHTPAVPV